MFTDVFCKIRFEVGEIYDICRPIGHILPYVQNVRHFLVK